MLVAAVLAGGLAFTGWQIGQMRADGGPVQLAERGPLPQDPTTWPTSSGDPNEQSQQGAIAPGPPPESVEATGSPTASPSPVPVPTGRWAGMASVTVTGGDQGCRANTKTFRTPAVLRIEAPLRGDGNAVRVTFESDDPAAEGSFRVASSVPSTGRAATRWWVLSGNGAGGFVGRLYRPAEDPVRDAGEIDNLLFATRSLDQQCGALLSAPLSFPLGSGSSLRLTGQGAQRSVLVTGRTSDTTRSFQIAWAST
ncbi:hypothetical protein [Cryptosporangium arvum]|uniref:Uncharacterized protein n=1 Tax=Cryptosporangium arvum DSM 44712 TaxID=927661 RepID=A0A010ZT53_9ACTN|nr:hypothetical protein [Cryptosporangium arvum]EXG80392.1 hypothetical protein CryarDRAFT_1465 [Cryptosporangium arvum DSM 44712]